MDEATTPALLPAGLMDVLPPLAEFEAATVERLIAWFAGFGYERIKPPLIEYEQTMSSGPGAALLGDTFRLMDPASQRMLALRSDLTPQVARIAGSRLAHWPRPLRLSYARQVMRVRGTQLRPERQFGQVGAELFGSASPRADVEVMVMAATALSNLGVQELSIDLGVPMLVPAILADAADQHLSGRLRAALDRKDASTIEAFAPLIGADVARVLARLAVTSGHAEAALEALAALDLSPLAAQQRSALQDVYALLRTADPTIGITVDAVERRGFEYHSGVTFSLFAATASGELGRGGRYQSDTGEQATGVTLFMDTVLRTLQRPEPVRRVYVPSSAHADVAKSLRAQGWVAVAALDEAPVWEAEAKRLGCSHVWHNGQTRALRPEPTLTQES